MKDRHREYLVGLQRLSQGVGSGIILFCRRTENVHALNAQRWFPVDGLSKAFDPRGIACLIAESVFAGLRRDKGFCGVVARWSS